MLSKCANPECSEILRYLHEGKIFYLAPTPEVEIESGKLSQEWHERFWLCARCSQAMTLTWAGTHVSLVSKPIRVAQLPQLPPKSETRTRRTRARAASAGRED